MTAQARALLMLRHYRGMTQPRLAELSGVSRPAISDFERGEREPGPVSLGRLLEALELPERALVDTVRHVEWLDWLSTGAGSPVERVAASACRDLERHVVAILRLLAA